MKNKKKVYLHEFNILMTGKVYLPNVSGMLRAYAEAQPQIAKAYKFMPFIFVRQKPEKIIKQWNNPSVLAFSSSVWNHQLNLFLAKRARQMFPKVLIIFGGPHIPAGAEEFLKKNPVVDVVVKGEGEAAFAELLIQFLKEKNFSKVTGIVFRHPKTKKIIRTEDRQLADVNVLPSPYLAGLYDYLLNNREKDGIEYQMILETNRGCPFRCAFCFWGNGIPRVRNFDLERIRREIEWIGQKKVLFVFGADANFGMYPRDIVIAEIFAKQKKQTGFPRSFRVCYGKNATDRIFEVAKLLELNRLTTGVTVSFQSTDPETLKNIGRNNINLNTYRELLRRYREKHIRVYTELLLGLPGETYESFARGIEEVFRAGLYDQVGIFFCIVLPNTNMTDQEYVLRHGIKTRRLELVEPHALPRQDGEVGEFEDVVIATKSMPHNDWKRSARLAWMAQVIHGMKLGFFVALYLSKRFGLKYTEMFEYLLEAGQDKKRFPIFAREIKFYENYLSDVLKGKSQCVFLPKFGKISWQIEEVTFLRLNDDLGEFYNEMETLVSELLKIKSIKFNRQEISEVVLYQSARVSCLNSAVKTCHFSLNVPEYFDLLLKDQLVKINASKQILKIERNDYENNKEKFAKMVIWFGRRDCRTLESVKWRKKR